MSKERWIEHRIRLWEDILDEGTHCKGCEYCEITKDAFGTGDSPTIRECIAWDAEQCPGVAEQWVDGMYEGEDYDD